MYKAIIEIGGYKIGDEVPADKAKAWLVAYGVPHVEEVEGKSTEKVEEAKKEEIKAEVKKPEVSKKKDAGNVMLEDYLGRNTNVVKKNIEEDNLDKSTLENLLKIERLDKKRNIVIKTIQKKLETI